jgi:hypothetical protein
MYYYPNIEYVTMKRKGSLGRGMLFGGLIGIGGGILAGFIEGDDPPCEGWFCWDYTAGEKATIYGVGFGLIGIVAGAVIGTVARKKFIIGGSRQKFQEMKPTVLQKVYGNRIQLTE